MDPSIAPRFRAVLPAAFLATFLLVCPTICRAAAPATVYAGGAGDVFKSTDGGVTWTTIGSGLGASVLSLAIDPADPTILYAGTDTGAFKTDDGGAHWNPINNGLVLVSGNPPWYSAVTAMVVDPVDPATVYAATGIWGNGVFKSTNRGAHWTAINNGLVTTGSLDVRAMAMDPSDPNTLYLTGVTGLQSAKTTNGGANWTPLPVINFGFALVINPVQTSTVYIGCPFGMYKSVDGGTTWSYIVNGLTNTFVFSLAIDPSAPDTVYAGTGAQAGQGLVFKTTDGGAIWSDPAGVVAASEIVYSLAIDPANPSTIYAGGTQGVLKSTNGGVNWDTSLAASGIRTLAVQIPVLTSGSNCNGTYSGTFKGNLTVSSGQTCMLVGGGVTGNITQNGGSLAISNIGVGGNVQIRGGTFSIGPSTSIGGNLQIQNVPNTTAQSQVCGATVHNNLQFQNNGGAVLIGSADPAACAGNTINGNLMVQNNSAAATAIGNAVGNNLMVQNNSAETIVKGNHVTGNLQDQNNTAPTQVFSNIVGNNLQCQQNSSITGGSNTAKSKQGQCAAF